MAGGFSYGVPPMKSKRPVTFTTDHLGREIARVPLTRGFTATVLKSDYDTLTARGYTNWFANPDGKGHHYASVHSGNRLYSRTTPLGVVRVIVNCPDYLRVRFRDGDPMNLLPENLYTVRKGPPK